MPMLTGTLITAAGFLPIGLAQSVTGEYTFAIFAVTSAALVISWLVSVYFVPYLGTRILRVSPHAGVAGEPHELFDTPFYARFRALVNWCVKHRWITIGLTIASLLLGLAGMGKVQQQFFPDSTRPEILIDLWLPEGASYAANEALTQKVEARVMKLDGVAAAAAPASGSAAKPVAKAKVVRRATSSTNSTTATISTQALVPALSGNQ